MHFAVRVELKIARIVRFAVFRNEPEILTSFPYAYDAWSVSLFMNPLPILEGMYK
jgi:hypothetical protein